LQNPWNRVIKPIKDSGLEAGSMRYGTSAGGYSLGVLMTS